MADAHHSDRKRDITPKQILVGVLALILLIFALLNVQRVRVDFIFREARLPLIFVIVGSAILGFLIGWFVRARADRD